MWQRFSKYLFGIILLIGILLVSYPSLSEALNSISEDLQFVSEISINNIFDFLGYVSFFVGLIGASLIIYSFTLGRLRASASPSLESAISARVESARQDLELKVKRLSDRIDAADGGRSAEEMRATIRERVREEFGDNVAGVIGEQVRRQAENHARRESLKAIVETIFDNNEDRVGLHVQNAWQTARNFQWIGTALAIGGIVLASVMLFNMYGLYSGETAPRLEDGSIDYGALLRPLPFIWPLVLLIEILAYVMFRYSNKSADRMEAFSNEVSTLGLRRAGIMAVLETGDDAAVAGVAAMLLTAERHTGGAGDGDELKITMETLKDVVLAARGGTGKKKSEKGKKDKGKDDDDAEDDDGPDSASDAAKDAA